jgi:hypothetical protein
VAGNSLVSMVGPPSMESKTKQFQNTSQAQVPPTCWAPIGGQIDNGIPVKESCQTLKVAARLVLPLEESGPSSRMLDPRGGSVAIAYLPRA